MPEPHLRAADTDRAAVAAALGEHMAAGRLTLAEYDERVGRAYASRTFGELAELTTDLPQLHVRRAAQPAPASRPNATPMGACGGRPRQVASAWRAWLTTGLLVTTIWLIASVAGGQFDNFWPIWVIGPWGAVLLAHTLSGGGRPYRGHASGCRSHPHG